MYAEFMSVWKIQIKGDKYVCEVFGKNPRDAYNQLRWAENRPATLVRCYDHLTREKWFYDGERFTEIDIFTRKPKETQRWTDSHAI